MKGWTNPAMLSMLMAQSHARVSRKSLTAVRGRGLPAPTRISHAMGWHGGALLIASCAMVSLMPTDAWSQSCSVSTGVATCTAQGNLVTLFADTAIDGMRSENSAAMVIDDSDITAGVRHVSQGSAGTDDNYHGGNASAVTFTNSNSVSLTPSSSDTLVVGVQIASIGGAGYSPQDDNSNGGNGGDANTVTVNSNPGADITIAAPSSSTTNFQHGVIGLLASSRGGAGGMADAHVKDHYGGTGGSSANAVVNSYGNVSLGTEDTYLSGTNMAWGVVAQSIGGKGGDETKGPDADDGDPTGAGGSAGEATVAVTGDVSVYWDSSSQSSDDCSASGMLGVKHCSSVAAVVASSVGGTGGQDTWKYDQGGSGGHAAQVTANIGSASTTTNITAVTRVATLDDSAAIMAISAGGHGGGYGTDDGFGGIGGNADGATATLTNTTVTTHGDNVSGVRVLAQGGDGGAAANVSSDASTGGDGGSIVNKNDDPTIATLVDSTITTTGTTSYGVLVQGIGGLGGFGTKQGGQGADGGYVTADLDNKSSVITSGKYAIAVVTQSLAGAGGAGGAWTSWIDGNTGDGGKAGSGGKAGVTSNASVNTSGEYAHGVLVQSIGGSGGTGATGTGVVALGGSGGAGGGGGEVTGTLGGAIVTTGVGAIGAVAQSIGGGGGNAGSASGVISVGGAGAGASSAGTVDVTLTGSIKTSAEAAIGLLGQSIGGGGGNAGAANGVSAVGGKGGAGGDGKAVTINVNSNGSITTSGLYAHGAVAQSIGGGGGNGGSVFSLSASSDAPALGGSGDSGGTGGDVNVNVNENATIGTTGNGATGLLMQSIGGGGGSGGSATEGALSFEDLAIGGKGSQGSDGGNVTLDMQNATITTQGMAASAITAQSIGGGGGNGGAAHVLDVSAIFGTAVAIGGSGEGGGAGGTVDITLANSTITTASDVSNTSSISDSYGVLAQSIGGGGGNGGSAHATNITVSGGPEAPFAISTSLAIGGAGGGGGAGGSVIVGLTDDVTLSTGGVGSHGVLAQSIGGGGGAGGASHAMSTTVSDPDASLAVRVHVSLGGQGGAGGHGGTLKMTLGDGSSITTADDFSNAMMGQSIGGGGGNAGVGAGKNGGVGKAIGATINVGGTGGNGGHGGNVSATLDEGSTLQTNGSGSRGLLLQSIGGGGGASQGGTVSLSVPGSGGGDGDDDDDIPAAKVSVSLGATGGSGGDGQEVTVTAQGAINTTGGDADGILAQSIGGGGGLAGSAGTDAGGSSSGSSSSSSAAALGDDGVSDTYAMSLAVGGKGGIAGGGSDVSLKDFTGTITTQGDHADGIVLQSIGGGGGVGGTATASGVKGASQVDMAVGGSGGAAGNGGAMTIDLQGDGTTSKGSIATTGDVAYGLLVQTIGGGGGQGADGSANTGQSSSSTPTVTLGASGSSPNGGWGNQITTGTDASVVTVSTQGFNSHGIVLQSIGGGGGTASVASAGVTGEDIPNLTLSLGGGGGTNHDSGVSPVTKSSGGHIAIEAWLNVQTAGEHAFGLVAQSIGGGGGIVASGAAANVDTITIVGSNTSQSLAGDSINISIGNYGSQSESEALSRIYTSGAGSHGIVLQSIGGGGGIAGYTANGALEAGWNGAQSGSIEGSSRNSGDVTLDYAGSITTTGAGAHGIIAQSIADGGGLAGDSAGSYAGSAYDHAAYPTSGSPAGSVTITQNGTLSVTGSDAYAIFAQSDGRVSNSNAVNVTIGGQVSASDAAGGGVWIDGTAQTNQITILAGGNLSATNAITQTGTGSTVVTNYGEVAGSMSLSDQGAALGTIENFGKVLRADNIHGHVINHRDFFVGETRGTASMHVTGDFTQTADGTLQIGADFVDQAADVLQVDGKALLDGKIRINSSRLMPNRTVVFLKSDNIDSNVAPQGASSLFDYSAQYSGNQATVAVGNAHFDTVSESYGAGRNLRELGAHLQDIWARGGSEALAGVYATLDQTAGQSGASFTDALSSLAPGISAAPAALKQSDMARFASSLLSCPHYEGTALQLSESSCVWGQISARTTSVDGSRGTSSFDASGVTYQVGVQKQIAPQWYVGASAAYENGHISADDGRQSMSGDTGYVGASLKYENGPWTVAGTLSGSYGSYDSTRHIQLPGVNTSAKSSPDVMSLGQRLRVAYTHNMGKAYIKPVLDLDLIYTRMPSYSEHGAGALNLKYEGTDKWAAILTPGVEVGGRIDLSPGYMLRPYLNLGLSVSSTDHWDSYARLEAAPSGSRSAKATLDAGRTFGRVTAGLQLFGGEQFDVRLQYDGLFSSQVHSHGGSLKANWRY